ncbi:hypothetical protein [Actinacidiphila sp. ITFR-21]|uniref:hypothetical protein n=1 Tax=Actinacidiphila sp. ITFR-21 TaxID=3075199 RepID=UPI00288AF870|nr:hypothetical protein [Streptomyces sp. ITFR-21]WNI14724.1 hypothetical protein RLT57_03660 [Streptomyces sp. ITFR-21]
MDALDRPGPEKEPGWIVHFDRAYPADGQAHCYLDLRQPELAARKVEEALSWHPEHRVRRRTSDLLLLATARFQTRDVEGACESATQAVTLLAQLRSTLDVEYLNRFRSPLRSFERESAARDFEAGLRAAAGRSILGRSEIRYA